MDALNIKGLSKRFGSHIVLDQLDLTVPEGSVFGFLGQNGAGKTTTMKLILGLLKADSGSIQVMGESVSYGQTKTNRFVGYLPDVPEFYGYMRPMEYLKLCGEIIGLSKEEIGSRSNNLLELVGLADVKKKINGFSRGMKQRLGIAQALLGEPKLLICDEPTSALDPVGRKEILDILHQVKGRTTVLFSTHILSDAERICDQVAILHKSQLALWGELAQIKAQKAEDTLMIELSSSADIVQLTGSPLLLPYKEHMRILDHSLFITGTNIKQIQQHAIAAFYNTSVVPAKMELLELTLEGIFMEAVQ